MTKPDLDSRLFCIVGEVQVGNPPYWYAVTSIIESDNRVAELRSQHEDVNEVYFYGYLDGNPGMWAARDLATLTLPPSKGDLDRIATVTTSEPFELVVYADGTPRLIRFRLAHLEGS